MSVIGWLAETGKRLRTEGVRTGVIRSAFDLYRGVFFAITSRYPVGTNIFSREWDVLVILDACRVDAMKAVSEEYDFVSDVGSILSVGSQSSEWMAKTFTDRYADEIGSTAYVTSNLYSERIFTDRDYPPYDREYPFPANWRTVDASAFGLLDEVWRYVWDDEVNTLPPRAMTDRAISVHRDRSPERLIVHYYQPHSPFIAGEPVEYYWDKIREGTLSREDAWGLYLDNLRLVLDEVSVLLENLDAERVVITADHGEAFGEWGVYNHPIGFPHTAVKRVPWVETKARDEKTRTPDLEPPSRTHVSDDEVTDRLRNLGYVQ